EVARGSCYQAAIAPKFYDLNRQQDVTRIDNVITSVDASRNVMTMIVTDLYQDRADMVRLLKAFREVILPRNLSVGVLALRSGFSGNIYDIGFRSEKRQWISSGNQERFRPFYVLVL